MLLSAPLLPGAWCTGLWSAPQISGEMIRWQGFKSCAKWPHVDTVGWWDLPNQAGAHEHMTGAPECSYMLLRARHVLLMALDRGECLSMLLCSRAQAEPNLLTSAHERLRFLRTLREPLEHLSRAGSVLKVNWERSQTLDILSVEVLPDFGVYQLSGKTAKANLSAIGKKCQGMVNLVNWQIWANNC
ncbi:hypothetical protein BDV93DRAFT_511717 [Ceratobasidium sp. AG-I]|nr:hypothetical protein BDV93DRAFT_511717 [Ceratobasidium sp. AG-I]